MSSPQEYKHRSEDGEFVYAVIDKDKLEGTYYIKKDSYQLENGLHHEIKLEGFRGIPNGFSREGKGFASPLNTFLIDELGNQLGGKIKLTLSKKSPSAVRKYRSGTYHLTLNYKDFIRLYDGLRELRTEKNEKSRAFTALKLSQVLPTTFSARSDVETLSSFAPDKLAKIIRSEETIVEQLSKNDIEAVAELYAEILQSDSIANRPRDIKVLRKGKEASERVYLEQVIHEFESKLDNQTHKEQAWQTFLRDSILLFNTSYVHVLEKLSVAIRGKYPDFMLVDVYDYVDIYEIKKPTTKLLSYDSSRDNYFWSPEMSKAIVQTEKYIYLLDRNGDAFVNDVKLNEGIEIRAVRPRGFIIAGKSEELDTSKKLNDFRILVSSLKNMDIIMYDDFLNSLKNLLDRLVD